MVLVYLKLYIFKICFSWKTGDFESCWESVVRLSWFWREKTRQRARRCRRCWPALTSVYERVRVQGVLQSPSSLCCCCYYSVPLHLSPYRLFQWSSPLLLVHLQHDSPKLHPCVVFQRQAVCTLVSFPKFLLILLLCFLILPACMSLWCLQGL